MRKPYGNPSPGREMFRGTDADNLHDALDMIEGGIAAGGIDAAGLTMIKEKVSNAKDWHYTGASLQCKPPL